MEAAALLFGIIELAEAVGELHLSGENFPALGPVRLVGFVFGERGDSGGELVDDRWLQQVFLGYGLEQIGNGFSRGLVGIVGHVGVDGVETLNQCFNRVLRGEIAHLWLGAGALGPEVDDGFAHRHALPVGPVDLLISPLGFRSARYIFHGLLDHALRQVHHVFVIGVGLVELEHGKFGIPAPAEAFVAEVAIDFVDAVQATDGEAL